MIDRSISRKLIIILIAGISLTGYLFASNIIFRIGFPLDDSWIHQTYARNLANNFEWSFIPGQPSAGSTAPLWSALLALGYMFDLAPHFWTYFLGGSVMVYLSLQGWSLFIKIQPDRAEYALWVGLFLVLEWHLVWAALSGMETILAALVILVVMNYLLDEDSNMMVVGGLIGLGVWIRPDLLTLLGPAMMVIYFRKKNWIERLQIYGIFALGCILMLLPYIAFNHLLDGSWWPNTFFAKQAEYASLRYQPLMQRYLAQLSLPLIGVGAVILPGFIMFIFQAIKKRKWSEMALLIWLFGFFLVYAVRLPVTYQHGRYVMPAMPVYFILSLVGISSWLQINTALQWKRILSRFWWVSIVLLLIIFWGLGAQAYAKDVSVIESEMVDTAKWVARSTPVDSLIAAHDIGALGYFAQRDLLDLAGLISPQVIPFIRNGAKIEAFVIEQGADYLITFPSLYPEMTSQATPIYQSDGIFSPELGGENMAVYALRSENN